MIIWSDEVGAMGELEAAEEVVEEALLTVLIVDPTVEPFEETVLLELDVRDDPGVTTDTTLPDELARGSDRLDRLSLL
jgi:hypothetical protein